jgi:hypothetical protein
MADSMVERFRRSRGGTWIPRLARVVMGWVLSAGGGGGVAAGAAVVEGSGVGATGVGEAAGEEAAGGKSALAGLRITGELGAARGAAPGEVAARGAGGSTGGRESVAARSRRKSRESEGDVGGVGRLAANGKVHSSNTT